MNLLEHAKRELELIGYTNENMEGEDNILNKDMYEGIIKIIEDFRAMGHSGYSADYCRNILTKLLNYENLSPVSIEDFKLDDGFPKCSDEYWQCKRNPSLFLNKDKTGYYDVGDSYQAVIYFNPKQQLTKQVKEDEKNKDK